MICSYASVPTHKMIKSSTPCVYNTLSLLLINSIRGRLKKRNISLIDMGEARKVIQCQIYLINNNREIMLTSEMAKIKK